MAKTLSGISLVIRCFVPTGSTMQEQIAALTAVDKALETKKFSTVMERAIIEDVKYTAGRKRFEDTGGVIAGDQTQVDLEEAIAASTPAKAPDTAVVEPSQVEEIQNDEPDADMIPNENPNDDQIPEDDDEAPVPEWMERAAAAEADLPKPVEAPRTDVPVAGKPGGTPINPAILAAAAAAKAKSEAIGNTAPAATQPAITPTPRTPAPAEVAAQAAAATQVTSGPRRRTVAPK